MKWNLKNKLIGLFLLIGLVPFLVIGGYSYFRASASLESSVFNNLSSIRDAKKVQVERLFSDIERDIAMISKSEDLHQYIADLTRFHQEAKVEDDAAFPVESGEYKKLITPEHTVYLTYYTKSFGYFNLFLICRDHGHVMYSVQKEKDFGTNLRSGPYRESALARVWEKVITSQQVAVEDFRPYAPEDGRPACFIGTPILEHSGDLVGVLVLELHIDTINQVMQQSAGLGRTGETYLVGPDLLMRSDARLDPVNRGVAASFLNPEKGRLDTDSVHQALSGETGIRHILDYHGKEAFSAYSPVDFIGQRWALIAEIDKDEALEAQAHLRQAVWLVGMVIVISVVSIGFFFSRSLSRPLQRGAQNLNTTSSEIFAAIQQQAGSMKEQAAAVQQTSSTMDEITETGNQVAQRAKEVAQSAEAASAASEMGISAVDATHEVMEAIREQVELVAGNIVELSEKTLAIGNIITTVNDIAEQSNLLALNASIEAVGAGSQGERFSVVANEMKNLADQAKESTVEVRRILNEIQSGINSSVMSTEEAVKRVEIGRSKSEVAAETIKQLTDTTAESISAFQQIVAGTGQQQIGLDQVTQALKDIHTATEQTSSGIGQIETAIGNLNDLSSSLKTIIGSD